MQLDTHLTSHSHKVEDTDAWELMLLNLHQNRKAHRETHFYGKCIVQESVHTQTYTCGFRSAHTELFSLCCLSHLKWVLLVDLTDEKTHHIHTNALLELKTWLSWISPCSPFLFSICLSVGEPVWGKMMPTIQIPCFTFCTVTVRLLYSTTCCLFTPLISTVFFDFVLTDFFPRSSLSPPSFLTHSALSLFAINPCPPSLHLCHFCGSVKLTNSQGETSAGVLAKILCLSTQITWDSPNYHVANQSISWVSAGDACPPLLWL